jgi:hypothetical protein
MTKSEFYRKHGSNLETINPDDAEYGENLVLYPEENHIAEKYLKKGHDVYTVYEESHEGGEEYVEAGFDSGTNPFKVGYLILKK